MKSKLILLSFLLLACSTSIFAHALWIETAATGTKGKAQEIKIFFGEFSDKDISPANKWFSDLKDFSLIVITPSRREIKLETKMAVDNYTAYFTPEEDGLYTVVMHHIAKDVYHGMKLDYNSSATVHVGRTKNSDTLTASGNRINVAAAAANQARKDQSVTVKAFYEGKTAINKEIKIIAPNGWIKELETDDAGLVVFTPLWPGTYMIEMANPVKSEGEFNGKKYESIWEIATFALTVK